MNIVDYIVKNWDNLPKSKFDDVIVVIFKEIENWNTYVTPMWNGCGMIWLIKLKIG